MIETAILTTQELAAYMKLNEKTILKMAQNREIPGVKVGSQWRFHMEAIDRYFQREMVQLPESALNSDLTGREPELPLSRLFDESIIELDLTARNREEVLRELSRMACTAGLTTDPEKLYAELCNRESLLSTAAGNGIAIPHPRTPDSSLFRSPNILLARSFEGVDFDAPDNQRVRLFFMTCAPSIGVHLKLLAKLSELLHTPDAVASFMDLPTGREIIQFLLKIEQQNLFAWESVEREPNHVRSERIS